MLLVGLAGCGGGSGSSNSAPPATPPITPVFIPVAKFTTSELTANKVYAAANNSWLITAYAFSPDGTLTEYVNMTTTSTSSASETLPGTYYIDTNGILIINTPGRNTEKVWKTTAALDAYNSLTVGSSTSSALSQWFFDATLGAPQALALAQGKIPVVTPPAITNANSSVFTVGTAAAFALTATGTPAATFSINGTLPPGISFNTKTGILSGIPTTAGIYTLTVTASNGVVPNASQTFFLPVNTPTTPVPVPKVWTVKSSPVAQNLRGVLWTGTQFIAVGDNGTILTSADGSIWVSRISGSTESLWSVAWSGTKYVVVGDMNGTVLTSSDGVTWAKVTTGRQKLLRKVIWANNQFMAAGWGTVLTSPDGTSWTQREVNTDKEISNVIWTGTNYVAIGGSYGTLCMTSTDNGVSWAPQNGLTDIYNGLLFGLAWNGSKMVTTGWGGTIASSTNGSTWNKSSYGINNMYATTWTGDWKPNQFIAVGNNGAIINSLDGDTWAAATSPTTSTLQDITCSSTRCVAVGGDPYVSTILLFQ